ncbi:hypothetical protein CEXT_720891 [Caerostris extrusa]|uniref:Uncharacterized protein n=1 Tax=Caerostris extrusa TaxID=172846 RepID=A0AAV4R381_CAEEX|nr:hypothetical protein CEXT_720891 [Caerostris extrusa]
MKPGLRFSGSMESILNEVRAVVLTVTDLLVAHSRGLDLLWVVFLIPALSPLGQRKDLDASMTSGYEWTPMETSSSEKLTVIGGNLLGVGEEGTSSLVISSTSRNFERKFIHIGSSPLKDSPAPQQAFQTWFQKSHGPDHILSAGSTLSTPGFLLQMLMSVLTFHYHCAFQLIFHVATLTGIT